MTERPSETAGVPSRPEAPPPAAGVSRPDASAPRRASGPRRVRNGLRLRARDGRVAPGPLSDAVMGLLAEVIPAGEMTEGIEYARMGQIVSIQIDPGGAMARVQGRAVEPHRVRLGIGVYTDDDWKRIIDAMAGEAIYLVKLLANELPEGIGTLLASLGLVMLPSRGSALTLECSCGSDGRCRHVAAAGCVLAEQLQGDPMLVVTVRGLPAGRLLEQLRHERALRARGVASAHVDPMIPESQDEPADLEACREEYWREGPRLGDLRDLPPSAHAPHALLRRLGPSELNGKFPLVGLLASIYDHVRDHAARLRDRAEGIDENGVRVSSGPVSGADPRPPP